MKQYIYKSSEVGLKDWPPGVLRLEGFEVTENPSNADVFVYPGAIHELNGDDLRKLSHFSEHESRHVFFHCADHETLYNTTAIIIRCNTRDWYFAKDPNTVSWPWPVEDFCDCVDASAGFEFDVSFHGWRSSRVREESVDSVKGMKSDIAEYSDFFGYRKQDDPETVRRRAAFKASMKASRLEMCPESIPGVFPYRFFEALSAARVPLLVGSGYVLPWADVIPWQEIALFCPADEAKQALKVARKFLDSHSDVQVIAMGLHGRQCWDRFLNRDKWPALMAEAVQGKLAA